MPLRKIAFKITSRHTVKTYDVQQTAILSRCMHSNHLQVLLQCSVRHVIAATQLVNATKLVRHVSAATQLVSASKL